MSEADPMPAEPSYDDALNCWTYRGRCFYSSPTNINPQENAELHYLRDLCAWLQRRQDPLGCINSGIDVAVFAMNHCHVTATPKGERHIPALPEVPESGEERLPNGCTLYWITDSVVGCRRYLSDEIGGGVDVWHTALVDSATLLAAIVCEERLRRLELEHERRKKEAAP